MHAIAIAIILLLLYIVYFPAAEVWVQHMLSVDENQIVCQLLHKKTLQLKVLNCELKCEFNTFICWWKPNCLSIITLGKSSVKNIELWIEVWVEHMLFVGDNQIVYILS